MDNCTFQLGTYLSNHIERMVESMIRSTLVSPKQSAFMMKFAACSHAASRRRAKAEQNGETIPPFLIASITSNCNLHCAGCYARQNHACSDETPVDQLTAVEWKQIFAEAKEMGISFIILAGGEPPI